MFALHLRLGDSLPEVLSKRPLSTAFKETLPLTNVSYVLKSPMKGKGEGECGRKRRETSRFIFMCLRRCKDSPEHKGSHYCLPFVEFSDARKLTGPFLSPLRKKARETAIAQDT